MVSKRVMLIALTRAVETDPNVRESLRRSLLASSDLVTVEQARRDIEKAVAAAQTAFVEDASARLSRVEEILKAGSAPLRFKRNPTERERLLKHAEELEALAETFTDPETKAAYLELAQEERDRAERAK